MEAGRYDLEDVDDVDDQTRRCRLLSVAMSTPAIYQERRDCIGRASRSPSPKHPVSLIADVTDVKERGR